MEKNLYRIFSFQVNILSYQKYVSTHGHEIRLTKRMDLPLVKILWYLANYNEVSDCLPAKRNEGLQVHFSTLV